jgi:hypothetical protein
MSHPTLSAETHDQENPDTCYLGFLVTLLPDQKEIVVSHFTADELIVGDRDILDLGSVELLRTFDPH